MKKILVGILLFIGVFYNQIMEALKKKEPEPVPDIEPKPEPKPKPKPVEVLKTDTIPLHREIRDDNDIVGKVLNRTRRIFNEPSISTTVHETLHSLHAELRMKYRANGFFVYPDQAFICGDCTFTKSAVCNYVPECFRSNSRYNLYVKGQKAWDNQPLYIFDEWVAYTYGGLTAIENPSKIGNQVDPVEGALEFTIFSISLLLTAKHLDNKFYNNAQVRLFMKRMLEDSWDVFNKGREIFEWHRQEKTYNMLLEHPDAEDVRNCLKNEFEGVYLNA